MATDTQPRLPTEQVGDHAPNLRRIQELVAANPEATVLPISREIFADLETPVSAYLKINPSGGGFILESIEGGERIARYSFIGSQPFANLTLSDTHSTLETSDGQVTKRAYDDPLVELARVLSPYQGVADPVLPRFVGGAVGYLGYEAVRKFEPRVGLAKGSGLDLPDGRYMLCDAVLVFDHITRRIRAFAHVHVQDPAGLEHAYRQAAARVDTLITALRKPIRQTPIGQEKVTTPIESRFIRNTTPDHYFGMVERAREYIRAGDIFQVVLSQRIDISTPVHPFSIYRSLRAVNPSPYMFYLDFGDHQIIGASPELLVRLEDGIVTNHPIAGTRPRGQTPQEDRQLATELLADDKECAEHIMLVDLGRNDVGRVSQPGTVRVPKLMEVERFSHVMHIVSHVEGAIDPSFTGLDALRACFPAGTVSGAPKVRAMEIIAEQEVDRRGPYSGAVGYIDFNGSLDTCIALRTMVFKDGLASIQAGGGIVADSTPEGEYAESHHKMRALVRAIELAEATEARELAEALPGTTDYEAAP